MNKITTVPEFRRYIWNKIDYGGPGCWEWNGALFPSGYGACAGRNVGFSQRSHRAVWQSIYGLIEDGFIVCHHCDNRKCCRPSHMFLGTCADNHADRNQKNRQAKWENGGRAKITNHEAKTIKKRIADGESDSQIAADYPISPSGVWQIRRGQNWKGVEVLKMIDSFVKKWDARKGDLQYKWTLSPPESYSDIVKGVVEILSEELDDEYSWDVPDPERIHRIDDGDYQGTLVFVVACQGYQPSRYWGVTVSYGSCSGCDTFESIRGYSDDPLTEQQLKDFMTLALHIVQGLKEIS